MLVLYYMTSPYRMLIYICSPLQIRVNRTYLWVSRHESSGLIRPFLKKQITHIWTTSSCLSLSSSWLSLFCYWWFIVEVHLPATCPYLKHSIKAFKRFSTLCPFMIRSKTSEAFPPLEMRTTVWPSCLEGFFSCIVALPCAIHHPLVVLRLVVVLHFFSLLSGRVPPWNRPWCRSIHIQKREF